MKNTLPSKCGIRNLRNSSSNWEFFYKLWRKSCYYCQLDLWPESLHDLTQFPLSWWTCSITDPEFFNCMLAVGSAHDCVPRIQTLGKTQGKTSLGVTANINIFNIEKRIIFLILSNLLWILWTLTSKSEATIWC